MKWVLAFTYLALILPLPVLILWQAFREGALWKRNKPREGIFNLSLNGANFERAAQVRVVEVERRGDLSRVKVVAVTGVEPWRRKTVAGFVQEWMPTRGITWLRRSTASEREAA